MFYAHSENDDGDKHKLIDHLVRTAEVARVAAASKELRRMLNL